MLYTWLELRAIVRNTTSISSRSVWLQWTFLVAPYVVYMFWFMASLTVCLRPKFIPHEPDILTVTCCTVWTTYFVIACLRRCRVSRDLSYASRLYRTSLHMYMRLCIFTVIQLFPILLTAINYRPSPQPPPTLIPREATEIMECTYPLAVFLVFGTQSAVLRAWKILPQTSQVDEQA
ncbi:hypothetical protein JB92DRAFT_2983311 [Gautieria morchelliformis]|nr:hypothetical protein JB92DRAFT_2983311 [Gautieria morchelliformis]